MRFNVKLTDLKPILSHLSENNHSDPFNVNTVTFHVDTAMDVNTKISLLSISRPTHDALSFLMSIPSLFSLMLGSQTAIDLI